MQNLPSAVQTVCETWNSVHTNEFPNIGSWVRDLSVICLLSWVNSYKTNMCSHAAHSHSACRLMKNNNSKCMTNSWVCFHPQRNAFANDTIPSESYISAIQAAHLGTLSCQSLPLASSLKHILLSLVRLTGDLIVWVFEIQIVYH